MATTDTAIQGLAPQGIYDRFIRPALPEPEIFEKPRNLLWGFIGIHVVYLLGLLPNIVAVDFYRDGDVFPLVEELR